MNNYNPYFQNTPNAWGTYPNQYQGQPDNTMKWVQGEAGANAFIGVPGSVNTLFDSTRAVFYIKSFDAYGKPQPLEAYDYVKHVEAAPAQPDMSQYVTKAELKEMLKQATEKEAEK